MQLKKQSFEKLLHPPSSTPPLRPLPKGPLSSPFLKAFHLFRKGGNRFGDEKFLRRKKEIQFSTFLLLSLNFHYNPIPPHFIPAHSTFKRKKLTLDLQPYPLSFLSMYYVHTFKDFHTNLVIILVSRLIFAWYEVGIYLVQGWYCHTRPQLILTHRVLAMNGASRCNPISQTNLILTPTPYE